MERQKNEIIAIPDINVNDYDYNLPEKRIAKYPLDERDASKLLVYRQGKISEEKFIDIAQILPENSHLFFNNSRVIHARLQFVKKTGANIEIFCLEPVKPKEFSQNFSETKSVSWKCMVGNAKKWKTGNLTKTLEIKGKTIELFAEKKEITNNGFVICFMWNQPVSFGELIEETGNIPIPPYLNRNSEEIDKNRYQTIYAKTNGSVAAPTAGLHFSERVLKTLEQKNILTDFVTLHISAGTFKPVKTNHIQDHKMHREWVVVEKKVIKNLLLSDKIIAVGTTTLRTLESLYWLGLEWMQTGIYPKVVQQWSAYKGITANKKVVLQFLLKQLDKSNLSELFFPTELIIIPGYKFKIVQGIITNFHQPRSTLLLLIAAFTGKTNWKKMYHFASENDFRFLSYGDSCLILP